MSNNITNFIIKIGVVFLNPNPPKDTDGRREDSGRGARELQGRWPGLHWGRWEVDGRSSVAAWGPYVRLRELRCAGWRENMQQGTLADRGGASLRGRWVSCRWPSGREWNGSQPGQGAAELGFPGPALWQMQGEAARRAGNPSRQTEEPSSEGLGGHDLLTQTNPRRPAGQVMRHHLDRQPGAVGGEAARWEMVQPHAVLEASDGILDLGVAAMVGLQFQGFPVPVGDEAVIAVGGEEGQLGTGRGLHPPDDEPHRRGIGLTPEGVQVVSTTSAAPSIQ